MARTALEFGLYVLVVVAAVSIAVWLKRRQLRAGARLLVASRPAETLESLLAEFRPEVRPIAAAVVSRLQEFTYVERFPFKKSDRLLDVISLDAVDLQEELRVVATQFGCRRRTKEDLETLGTPETLEQYVEFPYHLRGFTEPAPEPPPKI